MKEPLAHNYLSEYLPKYEKKNLINYYKALIKYKSNVIEEKLNEMDKLQKQLKELKELIIILTNTVF